MRVVIIGASGFLGHALATAFARDGEALLCTARDPDAAGRMARWPAKHALWLAVDLGQVPDAAFWVAHLRPGDVVINAAGILRERMAGDFDAVHHRAPVGLFDACVACGVSLVVQMSALGASADAASGYHRSKGLADRHLRSLRIASAIVQPSLVWGRDGASANLFAALSVLPVLALPEGGRQALQPIHLDDVVAGVRALVHARPVGTRTIAFVGPVPISLREYLHDLRLQLGYRHGAPVLTMPRGLFLASASLAGRLRRSFLDEETAGMLLRGNAAPADDIANWLQRPPRAHHEFIPPTEAEALRQRACLRWLAPLLRLSIAFVWIWTFAASIGLYPRAQSLDLLAQVGAHGAWAELLLTGAAVFDLALGIGTLALPAASRSRYLWPLQLVLIGFYTAAITLAMPYFWLHPFGPLSKNVPMCAAIITAWALDGPARRRNS
ncbi:MAG: SDR family oxidoreductase [Variovorax sp.]|nr:MAG: SDR family oxidoreductase [Variovorax sp.]